MSNVEQEIMYTIRISGFGKEDITGLDVSQNITGLALKKRILEEKNIPIENQRLLYRGESLKDGQTLWALIDKCIEDTNTLKFDGNTLLKKREIQKLEAERAGTATISMLYMYKMSPARASFTQHTTPLVAHRRAKDEVRVSRNKMLSSRKKQAQTSRKSQLTQRL
tara:strand:+ start:578 stop:1075 length:498 start_codon:yes stop_codon:yes gene_type:complete